MSKFHDILQQYWGYDNFRPLQEEIIQSVYDGKDTLGLMPTGGGKSLTFQVPAMAMEGLCLVVTPLIALIKDQVDNLRSRNIKALAVYSGMGHQEILTTLDNAIYGDFKFLYISPERLGTKLFLQKIIHMKVSMLVVDEAHCISQWGYDFRPSYLKIADIRETIGGTVPILALTATATKGVVDDIQNQLQFKKKNVFSKSFERSNLAYIVRHSESKQEDIVDISNKIKGSTIVYVRSRKRTKEISDFLNQQGCSSDYYHAGLTSNDKTEKQNAWKNDETKIMVCTNAFGMGIDKPNVRLVIHVDLPNSIEEYFQEAGRAGRDERKAYAVILHHKTDITKLKKRIKDEFPEREFILRVYDQLAYYYQIADGYGMERIYDFDIRDFCKAYKLPLLPTHNALKILDLSGYIEYQDEANNRSRMMILAYRNELYNLNIEEKYNSILNCILRLYTGLFANYVNINETEIAQRMQLSRHQVYESLVYLSKQRIIDYVPQKKIPIIAYSQPRQESKYIVIPKIVYEQRLDKFSQRITSMCQYTDNKTVCRSKYLLKYFDEDKAKDCGQCDVCLSKKRTGLNQQEFNKIEQAIKDSLKEQTIRISDLKKSLSKYDEKKIMAVVQFMLEHAELNIDVDAISLVKN